MYTLGTRPMLLTDDELERSAVVANCRMNRERGLAGSNGYDRELGFEPIAFLKAHARPGRPAAWLDLCCGSGKALIEAALMVQAGRLDAVIVGVDLVGYFLEPGPEVNCLTLVEASWRDWHPDRAYDLITCVHGMHYVGDKLGLLARSVSWLTEHGRLAASLDPSNLRLSGGEPGGRVMSKDLRAAGLVYDRRRRLVLCDGRRDAALPYAYLGADDRAGPNVTGQPAVNSYYRRTGGCPDPSPRQS
ncbi:Trans-aconitate 2-methyltransferase [Aquisphaera giovannonii]|uniref:Trans-aconitate 2-methyltransferase n=1 Tax=Aquisphaera giovannonii TaxID=406548 RepID=A0A5B9WB83_9BACT|nr:class I SAM-dependent methyltransferase [Aquisphaera giovannonii]QEH37271.1 Trans-aconitate 2-methyltransferase [Aquisphaera giovannonii]